MMLSFVIPFFPNQYLESSPAHAGSFNGIAIVAKVRVTSNWDWPKTLEVQRHRLQASDVVYEVAI